MSPKKLPALQLASFRAKPKTLSDIDALATQHGEHPPDLWRASVERGLPIVALLYGANPHTRQYGPYTEEELTVLLQPIAALIQGFMATQGMPFALTPGAAWQRAPAEQDTHSAGVVPLPMDAAVAEALAGLGIDLDL